MSITRTRIENYVAYSLTLDIECALEDVINGRFFQSYFFVKMPGDHMLTDNPEEAAELLMRIAEAWGIDMPITAQEVAASLEPAKAEEWRSYDSRWEATPLWKWLAAYFRGVRTRAILMGWQAGGSTYDPGGYGPDEGV